MQLRLGVHHCNLWRMMELRHVRGRGKQFQVAGRRREIVWQGVEVRLLGGRRWGRGGELRLMLLACLQPLECQREVGQVQLPWLGQWSRKRGRILGWRAGHRRGAGGGLRNLAKLADQALHLLGLLVRLGGRAAADGRGSLRGRRRPPLVGSSGRGGGRFLDGGTRLGRGRRGRRREVSRGAVRRRRRKFGRLRGHCDSRLPLGLGFDRRRRLRGAEFRSFHGAGGGQGRRRSISRELIHNLFDQRGGSCCERT